MIRNSVRRLGVIAAGAAAMLAWHPGPAQAHPMGNFSINHYTGVTLRPDRVDVFAAVDFAEIPTLQAKPGIDTDGDGTLSVAEQAGHATAECARLSGAITGAGLLWTVTAPSYRLTSGSAGLSTSRLECRLSAPGAPSSVRVDDRYLPDRIGWREMTATGDGVRIVASTVPAESISDELRSYPRDPLSSPPDTRSATISIDGPAGAVPEPEDLDRAVSGPAWLVAAQGRLESTLGGRLTPLVVGLAVLLALLLGAGHAALPGHGKTVMAAYFAGRPGGVRDALAVGGTVTIAHTGGVLLVGLLLSTSTALAGERLLSWLGVASGVLVAAVGVGMLVSALRKRRQPAHTHRHGRPALHTHTHHQREQPDNPTALHTHTHQPTGGRTSAHGDFGGGYHRHGPGGRTGRGRLRGPLGLAGIGLAGGLVPSPSALVVLLGAIGLGRAGLGVLLVLAYGLGMAATLTTIGLLLVTAQRRLGRLVARGGRWAWVARFGGRVSASTPAATAALVVLVGVGMGVRAVA